MDYLFDPIAAFCIWTFKTLMEPLGYLAFNPNSVFIVVGFVGLFYWLNLQKKFNKKAEKEGGIK